MKGEYLEKDEARDVSLPPSLRQMGRDVFTFHGHRLSSLYRKPKVTNGAIRRVNAPSSFRKILHGGAGV